MLVCGSMHDERVPYWMPLKWIAKMRQENKYSTGDVKMAEMLQKMRLPSNNMASIATIDG